MLDELGVRSFAILANEPRLSEKPRVDVRPAQYALPFRTSSRQPELIRCDTGLEIVELLRKGD